MRGKSILFASTAVYLFFRTIKVNLLFGLRRDALNHNLVVLNAHMILS